MKAIFSIIILALFTFTLCAQNYEPVKKFDPNRNPENDLKAAVDYAKSNNKRIILDVGGEWCIWCHRIDAFMDSTKEVKDLTDKDFVIVKINFSKENKNEKFLSKYPEIQGYPHFFMLDKNGKLLHSQNTGDLEKDKGYDKDKFVAFLNKWKPGKTK
jgi:thioredoxin-related protein